jgi:hypothetical protein
VGGIARPPTASAADDFDTWAVCAGKFKQPVGQDTALQLAELQEILRSQDSQKVTSAAEGGVISDAELRQLLDRSNDGRVAAPAVPHTVRLGRR